MNGNSTVTAIGVVLLVLLAGIAGSMVVATQTATSSVSIDATPSDSPPASGESTHTVVFTVGTDSPVAGQALGDVKVDYSVDQPTAQIGNVGASDIVTIGIDRGGDNVGTRVDETATVSSVTGQADGKALLVETGGSLTLQAGDEVVLVAQQVQNPDTSGTAQVDATVNSQGDLPDTASGSVTYEYNNATVDFRNQETTGDTVTVDSVNLSEAGFVAISNTSSADSNEIRGSVYLPEGQHTDVQVTLDEPVESDQTLYAQAHLDTDGDRRFDYTASGGGQDELYKTKDGNIQTNGDGASAQVTVVESTSTPTPTPTDGGGDSTPTPTPTATDSGGDDEDPDPDISDYTVTADGDEITVSFDSDENLVDIEVDVSGPDGGTLHTEDFDGNRYEGYTATYVADSDGDYTLELVTAEDSSGNDGADDGDYSGSATVDTADDGTPTDDGSTDDGTPTDDGSTDGDETPTDDGSTDGDDTPTEDDSMDGDETPTEDDSMDGDDTPTEDDSMDGDDTSTEDDSMDDGSGDDGEAGGDEADGTEDGSDGDGAGFGSLVAVTALLASALLFYRRR